MGELVVGFGSALDFWRAVRVAAGERDVLDSGGTVYGARSLGLSGRIRRALTLCATDPPLDVVVGHAGERCKGDQTEYHVWRAPLTEKHLVSLGNNIKVCCMPAVFTQLGSTLDDIDLALIAYEMAGTYGLAPDSYSGMESDLEELVGLAELRGYAEAASALKIKGAARALSALGPVVPGSNSPRESELGLALSLSRRRGGAELGGFKMNVPIRLPAELAEELGQAIVKPDFSWPNGTVVEYDSEQEHNRPSVRARDERKRRAYQRVGMDCLTLSNEVLRSNAGFSQFIEDLEQSLGKRRKPLTEHGEQARRDLRERLFGPEAAGTALAELNNAGFGW